jgi:selenophosphate synthase
VPNLGTEPRERVLIDPQTSGGLLGGVPPAKAEASLRALTEAGMTAAIVGVVEDKQPDAAMIRIGANGSLDRYPPARSEDIRARTPR